MTEQERALHAALIELEGAASSPKSGGARPNLLTLFERIGDLAAALPPDADPELRHFLDRRSYAKARERLEERARRG